jgi:linoleoyl-CoA desaturase
MAQESEKLETAAEGSPRAVAPIRSLKFSGNNSFQSELRRRVEEYFRTTGRRQRDCPQMYLKTVVILAVFSASYALLVLAAQEWWQALPLALVLALCTAAIGFNIQHDGGHQAYSNLPIVNKLMAISMDLIGGSSYFWRWKHGVLHHTYVNITGHDTDVDLGLLGRLTPHQEWRWFFRWQHIYLWPLYGLIAVKWQILDDFWSLASGRVGGHRTARPRGWDLAVLLGGKAVFFFLAFGVPLLFHPFWVVLLYYGVTVLLLGMVLSVIFQLAHCVEQAEFPLPRPDSGRMEEAWAIHQIHTTVDFARGSRLLTWLLGGLNFQVEHHLFPRICHVNYPAISKVVEGTCREFGVTYKDHGSFLSGLASHYRWLREMGERATGAGEGAKDPRRP